MWMSRIVSKLFVADHLKSPQVISQLGSSQQPDLSPAIEVPKDRRAIYSLVRQLFGYDGMR
jgi:hypothetical protein